MNKNTALKISAVLVLIVVVTSVPVYYTTQNKGTVNTRDQYGTTLGASPQTEIIMNVETNQNYPGVLPYYKVLSEDFDEKVDSSFMKTQDNIPSEERANDLAVAYLQSHGGLPNDAVLNKVEQQKLQKIDYNNGQVVEEYPLGTEVTYTRELNGLKVVGPGDFVFVSLGENGKVLCYQQSWRELQLEGDINLISVNDAVTKLQHGDYIDMALDQYQSPVTITQITPGYYANNKGEPQDYYYPIWVFSGTDSAGVLVQISIEATTN